MAELVEAFSKLGGTENKNKLFCFYTRTPVQKLSEELLKNTESSEYEWKNKENFQFIEILHVELPVSNEIQWELFSDEGYNDKGRLTLGNESRNNSRFLTFTIDSLKDGKNFFINLKALKFMNNNNMEIVEDVYDTYNCFINIDKLIESNLSTNSNLNAKN